MRTFHSSIRNLFNWRSALLALALSCYPALSMATTITFETLPDGTTPVDNAELTASYVDGPTIVTFGFDTNADLSIDVNARFERRGTDPIYAYVTDTQDDLDKTATGEGGDWILRNPQGSEPGALNLLDNAFLVKYSGALATSVSGQIWDVDAGEQYNIEAFDVSNLLVASVLSPVGPDGCCGGPADGLPFTFAFTNLGTPIAALRITQIQGDRAAGFAFDNFSTTPVPEPSSGLLFLGGIAVLVFRLRRDGGKSFFWQ